MEVLKTESLKKYYNQSKVVVKAIDGVDITVSHGEFIAIVGSSGSGDNAIMMIVQ